MKPDRTHFSILFRLVKDYFKRLQNGPLRCLVAVVGTIQQSIKFRSPIVIYVDNEGDWHNSRRDISLISPELNVASWQEVHSATIDYWCHNYKPRMGDTVIDIGAGIGDDTTVFSRLVGKSGRVIAVEAHPHTYRCLSKTIATNRLENVIAVNAAVSDNTGHIAISTGNNYLSNSIRAGADTVNVRALILKDILTQTETSRISLIKMNIEGGEASALEGMKDVLHRIPHIVVSCHDFKADRGESSEFRTYNNVRKLLENSGFKLSVRQKDPRPEVRYYLYGHRISDLVPANR